MFLIPADARNCRARALFDANGNRWWAYQDLAEAVERSCDAFRAGKKSLVFLFSRNTAGCVIAYLSAIESGHAVALLDEALAADFKSRLLEIYRPEFVLSSQPVSGYEAIEHSSLPGLFVCRGKQAE